MGTQVNWTPLEKVLARGLKSWEWILEHDCESCQVVRAAVQSGEGYHETLDRRCMEFQGRTLDVVAALDVAERVLADD